jgi:hypothetical protein
MLSRRSLLIGGTSCAFVAVLLPSLAAIAQEEADFVCDAIDPTETAADGEVTTFAGTKDQQEVTELAAKLVEAGLTEYGAASVKDVWRKGDGLTPKGEKITLGVAFWDGSDSQKKTVETLASKWLAGDLGKLIAFKFGVELADAQISITFNTDRNSSLIGRQSRNSAKTSPSMKLGQQVERTICHEFGHALGLKHEQGHPGLKINWNKARVYADMEEQGWTKAMVDTNVFQKFSAAFICAGDPDPNLKSIMLYPIPSRWTTDNFSIGQNSSISEGDLNCAVSLYSV